MLTANIKAIVDEDTQGSSEIKKALDSLQAAVDSELRIIIWHEYNEAQKTVSAAPLPGAPTTKCGHCGQGVAGNQITVMHSDNRWQCPHCGGMNPKEQEKPPQHPQGEEQY